MRKNSFAVLAVKLKAVFRRPGTRFLLNNRRVNYAFLMLIVCMLSGSCLAAKISKQTILSQGKKRSYYLFVPDTVKAAAPLLIVLHGSGRKGDSLVEKWKDIASKEGLIVAGPNSQNSNFWNVPEDGPDFLRDLVEDLKAKYPVNPRRVYLFGHSAGGIFALNMSMLEAKYFAATAVHAAAWREPNEFFVIEYATRKIPIAIVVGDQDEFFPLPAVTNTNERLREKGFAVELTVMKGHNHWYYDLAPKINRQLWDYLKKYELAEEPVYKQHQFPNKG